MNAKILAIPLAAALVGGCAWLNEQPYYIPGGSYVQRIWVPSGGYVEGGRRYYYDGGRRYYIDGAGDTILTATAGTTRTGAAGITSTNFAARSVGSVSSSGTLARHMRGWSETR